MSRRYQVTPKETLQERLTEILSSEVFTSRIYIPIDQLMYRSQVDFQPIIAVFVPTDGEPELGISPRAFALYLFCTNCFLRP